MDYRMFRRLRRITILAALVVALLSQCAEAATCVTQDAFGNLQATSDPLSECTGWALMDVTEYTEVPTLHQIFAMPELEDAGAIWLAGFSLPMIVYLVAWGFGVVVNFFKPENERY